MLTNIFADKALSDRLIRIVRQSLVDPNFLSVSCQNLAELMSKREGPQGLMMETRKLALRHFLQEMVDDMLHSSNGNPSKWDHHVLRFLEENRRQIPLSSTFILVTLVKKDEESFITLAEPRGLSISRPHCPSSNP